MENDRRPFYIWTVAILTIIALDSFLSVAGFSGNFANIYSISTFIKSFFSLGNLIYLIVLFAVILVPIWISGLKISWRNRLGYGIPVLLLIPIPYFVWDYYTCVGKLCNLGDLVFGWSFGVSAIVFALFYIVGVYSRKWSIKFIVSLVCFVLLVIVGVSIYL